MTMMKVMRLLLIGFLAPSLHSLTINSSGVRGRGESTMTPSIAVPMIKTASSLAEHKAVIVFRHTCMKKQYSSQLWADEAVEHRMVNSKVFMAFCPTTGELVGSAEIFNVGRQRGAHYLQNLVVSESYRRQ